jgi:chromosome segregation ATPase
VLGVPNDAIRTNVKVVAEGYGEITQRLDRLETRFDGLEARFDGLEARFDGLEARFDGLEARFDGLATRFGGLESRMSTVETKLDAVAADSADTRKRVKRIEQHLGLNGSRTAPRRAKKK